MPDGDYPSFENFRNGKKIEEWINDGGKLIALAGALNIFADTENFALKKNYLSRNNHKNLKYETLLYFNFLRPNS